MKVEKTEIEGVLVITPVIHRDSRGSFAEVYNRDAYREAGISDDLLLDGQSRSTSLNTIRGLHYQAPPYAQAKLVRVGKGAIFDVAVDARKGSETFGKWVGYDLTADNQRQLFIPCGCLHGFVTRERNSEVLYKCSGYYAPDYEGSVRFDDADIGIDWGVDLKNVVASDSDLNAQRFANFQSPFLFES